MTERNGGDESTAGETTPTPQPDPPEFIGAGVRLDLSACPWDEIWALLWSLYHQFNHKAFLSRTSFHPVVDHTRLTLKQDWTEFPDGLPEVPLRDVDWTLRFGTASTIDGLASIRMEMGADITRDTDRVSITNPRCITASIGASVAYDTARGGGGHAWRLLWELYSGLMRLTPAPQPTAQSHPGSTPPPWGTAMAASTLVPSALFGRDPSIDPGTHHAGPMVHLSPTAIDHIGDPHTWALPTGTTIIDLRHQSPHHGIVIGLPPQLTRTELINWNNRLAPIIRTHTTPTPLITKIFALGAHPTIIPPDYQTHRESIPQWLPPGCLDHPTLDHPTGPNLWTTPYTAHTKEFAPWRIEIPSPLNHTGWTIGGTTNIMIAPPHITDHWIDPIEHLDERPIAFHTGTPTYLIGDDLFRRAYRHPNFFPALIWVSDWIFNRSPTRGCGLTLIRPDLTYDTILISATKTGTVTIGKKINAVYQKPPLTGKRSWTAFLNETQNLMGPWLNKPPNPKRWASTNHAVWDIMAWLGISPTPNPPHAYTQYLHDQATTLHHLQHHQPFHHHTNTARDNLTHDRNPQTGPRNYYLPHWARSHRPTTTQPDNSDTPLAQLTTAIQTELAHQQQHLK